MKINLKPIKAEIKKQAVFTFDGIEFEMGADEFIRNLESIEKFKEKFDLKKLSETIIGAIENVKDIELDYQRKELELAREFNLRVTPSGYPFRDLTIKKKEKEKEAEETKKTEE